MTIEKFLNNSCATSIGVHIRDINMNTLYKGSYSEFIKSDYRNTNVFQLNWERYVLSDPSGLYLVCKKVPERI